MVLFHDHQRVATTYEEADPMSWTDGPGATPPPRDGGRPDVSTQPADASASPEPTPPADASLAPPTGGTGEPATGGSPATGGRGSPPPTPPAGPPTTTDPPATSAATGGCGCRTSGSGMATTFLLPIVLAIFWGARRRKDRAQTTHR